VAAGGGGDEAFLDGLVDEGKQRVVVAVHVEQAHRLAVDVQVSSSSVPYPPTSIILIFSTVLLRIMHHVIRINGMNERSDCSSRLMNEATWIYGGRKEVTVTGESQHGLEHSEFGLDWCS
jgi:hypothetical protein